MTRVEKNAAGELVPVDTAEFGCIVIQPEAATPDPEPAKSKAKAAKGEPEAADEGETA
jgi:hypothetical protein